MQYPFSAQIIIIAPAGRKRDNLVSLAASLGKSILVRTADSCRQAQSCFQPSLPSYLLLDDRAPARALSQDIEALRRSWPDVTVVLLRNRLRQNSQLNDLHLPEVIYDDISREILEQLLAGRRSKDPSIQRYSNYPC